MQPYVFSQCSIRKGAIWHFSSALPLALLLYVFKSNIASYVMEVRGSEPRSGIPICFPPLHPKRFSDITTFFISRMPSSGSLI
jgi:hypothetical protein